MSNIPPNIYKAISRTIKLHEGGYVNDPVDKGGETKYGISKRSYPNVNIKALTMEQAINIYWDDWWNKKMPWLLKIKDERVAAKIFDIGINVGEGRISRMVQTALTRMHIMIAVDNQVGAQTITALNACDPNHFLREFSSVVNSYYVGLVSKNRAYEKFLKGWQKRAYA